MKKLLFLIIAVLLSGCVPAPEWMMDSENKTTDTDSTQFETREEKIDFLAEYLHMPTEILDAEYHIRYYDNSTGLIPGPSDWHVIVAVKVETDLIDQWVEDMEEITIDEIDMAWWNGLSTENIEWQNLIEAPECYKRPASRSYLLVYRTAGILLKYVYTM